MMAVDGRRLSSVQLPEADRARLIAAAESLQAVSRRQQALLAGAGQSESAQKWFVLRTLPSQEKAVERLLADARLDCWVPTETRKRRAPHARRLVEYQVPVLIGYVFARVLPCEASYRSLLGLKGVTAILGGAGGPLAVAEAQIARVRKYLELSAKERDEAGRLLVGDVVAVLDGPFKGFVGEVSEAPAERGGELRALVDIILFGRSCPIDIAARDLCKG